MRKFRNFPKNFLLRSNCSRVHLLNFLRQIKEKNFSQNKKISSPPWKYIKIKKFKFFFLSYKRKYIVGAMVIINTKFSSHLSFLYIKKNFRKLGLGKKLIKFFISITKKKLLTVHIFKKDKRVLKFYKDNGFVMVSKQIIKKHMRLKIWKQKVQKFDNKSLIQRHILYFYKY
jgi:GNAT superfamily N-acetyltransferase